MHHDHHYNHHQAVYDLLFEVCAIFMYSLPHLSPTYTVHFISYDFYFFSFVIIFMMIMLILLVVVMIWNMEIIFKAKFSRFLADFDFDDYYYD